MPHLTPPATTTTIALFGGVYNNHLSLAALRDDARRRSASQLICLGDLGGFGPHPDRVFPYLRDDPEVIVMQGNYDHSIGHRLEDCACGYTDPRDNYFAQISYDYTAAHTSDHHKDWLRTLPAELRTTWANRRVLCAHGSPRKVNEFLWESASPDVFLTMLLDSYQADVLFITHTGIPWIRRLEAGRLVVNVGAIGRPANNGQIHVEYALLTFDQSGRFDVELIPLHYDHERLAHEMRAESLPEAFVETVLTGWWTTCLEILPAKERARGIF